MENDFLKDSTKQELLFSLVTKEQAPEVNYLPPLIVQLLFEYAYLSIDEFTL